MAVNKDSINSVIGPGSIFEGKFYVSGSLRIDGKFEGDLRTDEAIYISETGKVKTNISAKEVVVSGTLIGNIKAENEVRFEENGKMLGDITTPNLELAKGVVVKGSVTITGNQKKDAKKIIEESYGGIKSVENGKD